MQTDEKEKAKENNEDASIKPDPETLHTTDPQEHMKGPISSLMHAIEKKAQEEDGDKEDETSEKRD